MYAKTGQSPTEDPFSEFQIKNLRTLTQDVVCKKKEGVPDLLHHQELYKEYVTPETPRRILLFNAVGTGKTISSIAIANQFIESKMMVYVAVPRILIENFKKELDKLFPDTFVIQPLEYRGRVLKNAITATHPNGTSYIICTHLMFPKVFAEYNTYNPCVLVVDEVQKTVSSNINAKTYAEYLQIIQTLHRKSSVILLTGTPIVDQPVEFALTMNYILPIDLSFDVDHFRQLYVRSRIRHGETEYEITNEDDFMYRISGHVGFYQGLKTIAFPSVEHHFVDIPMEKYQSELYLAVHLQKFGPIKNLNVFAFRPRNDFYMKTRILANIVPSEEGDKSVDYSDLVQLKKQSCKAVKILEMTKTIDYPCFVYSYFLDSGVRLIRNTLIANGFYELRWEDNGLVLSNENPNDPRGEEIEEEQTFDFDDAGHKDYEVVVNELLKFKKRTCAVIYGGSNTEYSNFIIKMYTDPRNHDGALVSMIIGSAVLQMGINLIRTRTEIIFDGAWNYATMEQVEARGIRFCGHSDLPPEERNVTVYRFRSYIPTKYNQYPTIETVDQLMYELADRKRNISTQFTVLAWRASFDCLTFKNVNEMSIRQDKASAGLRPGNETCYRPATKPKLVKYTATLVPSRHLTIDFKKDSGDPERKSLDAALAYLEYALAEGKVTIDNVSIVGYSTDVERRNKKNANLFYYRARKVADIIKYRFGIDILVSNIPGKDMNNKVSSKSIVKLEFATDTPE